MTALAALIAALTAAMMAGQRTSAAETAAMMTAAMMAGQAAMMAGQRASAAEVRTPSPRPSPPWTAATPPAAPAAPPAPPTPAPPPPPTPAAPPPQAGGPADADAAWRRAPPRAQRAGLLRRHGGRAPLAGNRAPRHRQGAKGQPRTHHHGHGPAGADQPPTHAKDNDTDHGPNWRVAMVVGATGPRSALHLDSRSTGGVAATRPRRCPLNRRVALQRLKTPFWRTRPRLRRQRQTQALREAARPPQSYASARAVGGCADGATRSRRVAARRVFAARWRGLRLCGGPARRGAMAGDARGYAEREGGCAEGLRGAMAGAAPVRRACAEGRDGGGCEGLRGARGRLRGARGGLRGGATEGREGGGCAWAEGLRGGRAGAAPGRRGYAEGREAVVGCAEGRRGWRRLRGGAARREGGGCACAEGLRGEARGWRRLRGGGARLAGAARSARLAPAAPSGCAWVEGVPALLVPAQERYG